VGNLIRASGDIDVYIIKGERESTELTHALPAEPPVEWARYGWAMLAVLLATVVAWLMHASFALENLVMVYLLGVVMVAARFGLGPAILCSVLNVVAFDLFFVPPRLTLAVADSQYLVTFAVMLTVAVLISSLTDRLRRQAQIADEREQRTAALYAMRGHLSSARGTNALLETVVRHVADVFAGDVVVLLPDQSGRLLVSAGNEAGFPMNARERGVAHWVYDLGRPAGFGTDTIPSAEGLYLPLAGTQGTIGVLGVRPGRAGRPLTPELLQLLEAFASQAALTIESDRLADEVRTAQVEAEAERLRSALLSSVSQDLRTPLSAISGAAGRLLEQGDRLDPATRAELAETISEEAGDMGRLVTNLLEMTRLESGAARLKRELSSIEGVVAAALTDLQKQLAHHRVTTRFPAELPPVPLDAALMEHVFVNLLENAAKYTPPGTPIEISAAAGAQQMTVEVADRGPGITPGEEERVFEKFYRGEVVGSAPGAGLGLTICRAVVEAHGGKIWVENRGGGGAAFRFTLPLDVDQAKPAGVTPS
jgi:two-component system sensor histidine kinase KdpD